VGGGYWSFSAWVGKNWEEMEEDKWIGFWKEIGAKEKCRGKTSFIWWWRWWQWLSDWKGTLLIKYEEEVEGKEAKEDKNNAKGKGKEAEEKARIYGCA